MTMRTLLLLLLMALPGSAAPVPKELKRNDADRMQGLWKEENGTRWYFDGEKLFAGGQELAFGSERLGGEGFLLSREALADAEPHEGKSRRRHRGSQSMGRRQGRSDVGTFEKSGAHEILLGSG